MKTALRQNWPEYLIEAAALGTFMLSAVLFTALLNHPASPFSSIEDHFVRRALGGLAMGLTAICLIYSPWGQRSGAHMNPALTLTFFRLGKIQKWDALFYMAAQCLGGVAGICIASQLFRSIVTHNSVNYVVTTPGSSGNLPAFLAETLMACAMMLMILHATNTPRLARFTGLFGGALVFLFITFEAPISGMSINPARTLGSAIPSGNWTSIWIYLTAPILGMFAAAELFLLLKQNPAACPKFFRTTRQRCIFCGFTPIHQNIPTRRKDLNSTIIIEH
jgi:aquaporin Z